MKIKCKKCEKPFRSSPLQYEQTPYCDSCYHIRRKNFIAVNSPIPPVEIFGFKAKSKLSSKSKNFK